MENKIINDKIIPCIILTNINYALCFEEIIPEEIEVNIDYMVKKAADILKNYLSTTQYSKEKSLKKESEEGKIQPPLQILQEKSTLYPLYQAANLLETAAKNSEKFHSYFHFEETFFQTIMGNHHFHQKNYVTAINHYRNAIKQHHQNHTAYQNLIMCYREMMESTNNHDLAKIYREAVDKVMIEAKELGADLDSPDELERPYPFFSDYIEKTLNLSLKTDLKNKDRSSEYEEGNEIIYAKEKNNIFNLQNKFYPPKNSFWQNWENYQKNCIFTTLEAIIADLQQRHRSYHHNAGLIYFNLGEVYTAIAKIIISDNKNNDQRISSANDKKKSYRNIATEGNFKEININLWKENIGKVKKKIEKILFNRGNKASNCGNSNNKLKTSQQIFSKNNFFKKIILSVKKIFSGINPNIKKNDVPKNEEQQFITELVKQTISKSCIKNNKDDPEKILSLAEAYYTRAFNIDIELKRFLYDKK